MRYSFHKTPEVNTIQVFQDEGTSSGEPATASQIDSLLLSLNRLPITEERMAFLRDSLARIIFEACHPESQEKRAPWREPLWQDAAERCIKNVLAEVGT